VDAFSDDGRYGITVIGFIGSVFSPYYARARKSGPAEPLNHCALNVCLYGPLRHVWAMTERLPEAVTQERAALSIGPSSMRWDGDALTIHIDETANPLPFPVRGVVRVYPGVLTDYEAALDSRARHRWRPLSPRARVEVSLEKPGLNWSGDGYLDFNTGNEPLEDGFSRWHWSRASTRDGAAVLYDVTGRDGARRPFALRIGRDGVVSEMSAPRPAKLMRTLWLMERVTGGEKARVVKTLEDTPFYARSKVAARLDGETVTAMHESLCLDRFRTAWVQTLLPYRMPRR
jgi:carotenoid 1,2-hydratase